MTDRADYHPGGYRYIPAVYQYAGGVAALPGYTIERVRFMKPVALAEGFARIGAHLDSIGRPRAAFCACELRSPAPFNEEAFDAFNRVYVGTLDDWGLYRGGDNPVARSNVCPEVDKPAEPSFYAFSYTVESKDAEPSFVIAGSAEAPEGTDSYRAHAVRLGETSPEALHEKARWVLGEMERRMGLLGFTWADVTHTHVYSVHDIHHVVVDEVVTRGAMPGGLSWHVARPPVVGLEYEMDVRGVYRQWVAS